MLDATECYQEGLQLPPIKLVEGGKLRQDLWNVILSHSRMAPAMTSGSEGPDGGEPRGGVEGLAKLAQRYGGTRCWR